MLGWALGWAGPVLMLATGSQLLLCTSGGRLAHRASCCQAHCKAAPAPACSCGQKHGDFGAARADMQFARQDWVMVRQSSMLLLPLPTCHGGLLVHAGLEPSHTGAHSWAASHTAVCCRGRAFVRKPMARSMRRPRGPRTDDEPAAGRRVLPGWSGASLRESAVSTARVQLTTHLFWF